MNLDQVIKDMEASSGLEKEAAAPNTEADLTAALEKAATAPVAETSADSGNVVESLMKMATQMAGTEKEAEVAHMALCGQAFADAAVSRLEQWEGQAKNAMAQAPQAQAQPEINEEELVKAAAEFGYKETMEKVAAAQQKAETADPEAEKLAEAVSRMSDDELVKVAAEAGYQETLEKVAADFKAGEDQALQEVHDTAATEFLKGAAETEKMLNFVQQQQQQG